MSATNSSITMKEVPTNIEIKVPPKSPMTFRVGSSSDPQNAQGLTHLLEHMIFTGSARYPKPNEIHEFLSHHGGDSNAVTEMDYTLFHLMVNNNDDFEDALKRFCDPFISPLFKEDCIENEINAVEHEFESIRQTDKSRLDQLKGHTAPPGHPFKRFTWGNRKSLTMLKKNKLLSLLRDHLNKFYVGCAMNLVLLGQDSVEVLQELVMDCFRRLKHGSETISSYISSEHPVWKKHTMYLSNSAEEIHLLDITWSVPPKKTPLQFLLIVLNHSKHLFLSLF